MEQWKKRQFIRDFKKLPRESQLEIVWLLREFERVMENVTVYQNRCPINRTKDKLSL